MIKMNIYLKEINLILKGDFKKTYELIQKKELHRALGKITLDTIFEDNITPYAFLLYFVYKENSFDAHSLIVSLLFVPFTFLVGAYNEIYYHSCCKNRLAKNIEDSIGNQLVLYGVPGGGLSDTEARELLMQLKANGPLSPWCLKALDETNYLEKETNAHLKRAKQESIAQDPKKDLEVFILTGRFFEAADILPLCSPEETNLIIRKIAFAQDRNGRSICSYAFLWMLLREEESAGRHLLLADVAWELFRYREAERYQIHGAEAVRFFHVHRAAELEPDNLEIQEKLLHLYEPGNESFDIEETKALVERVLKMNPRSEQAQRVQKLIF